MTIGEAISKIDRIKPNGYDIAEKIGWLSELDGMIKAEIIDTHEGGEDLNFEPYSADANPNTELLVAFPFDDIYLRYLEANIDYQNGEITRYNNSILLYNNAFAAFANFYNRSHMPKGERVNYY